MPPKIGVYVCHCGINIAHTVDVEEVARAARELPNVAAARDYVYMCSDPGQQVIHDDVRQLGLDRVVVASCSPRMHELTFRRVIQEAGLNPYYLQIANIREQCSWVHSDRGSATEKASTVVIAAVSRASLLQPLEERDAEVTPAALIVGGGIAGLQAALDIADAGYRTVVVEKQGTLGGHVAQLGTTFPTLDDVPPLLASVVERVQDHPRIELLTDSRVVDVQGFIGNFTVSVESHWAEPETSHTSELAVGAIIVATGFETLRPSLKPDGKLVARALLDYAGVSGFALNRGPGYAVGPADAVGRDRRGAGGLHGTEELSIRTEEDTDLDVWGP